MYIFSTGIYSRVKDIARLSRAFFSQDHKPIALNLRCAQSYYLRLLKSFKIIIFLIPSLKLDSVSIFYLIWFSYCLIPENDSHRDGIVWEDPKCPSFVIPISNLVPFQWHLTTLILSCLWIKGLKSCWDNCCALKKSIWDNTNKKRRKKCVFTVLTFSSKNTISEFYTPKLV